MKQSPFSRTIFNLRIKAAVLMSSTSERTDHVLQKLAGKIMPEVAVNRLHITLPTGFPEDDSNRISMLASQVSDVDIPEYWKNKPEGLPEGMSFTIPDFRHEFHDFTKEALFSFCKVFGLPILDENKTPEAEFKPNFAYADIEHIAKDRQNEVPIAVDPDPRPRPRKRSCSVKKEE